MTQLSELSDNVKQVLKKNLQEGKTPLKILEKTKSQELKNQMEVLGLKNNQN